MDRNQTIALCHSFGLNALAVYSEVKSNGLLESNVSYLLPMQMTKVEGALPVNEDYTTSYLIVNRRPDTQVMLAELEEHLKGQWTFDNSQFPQKATVGADMVFGYGTGDGPYSSGDFTYDTLKRVDNVNVKLHIIVIRKGRHFF